jgi:hypothetical protein
MKKAQVTIFILLGILILFGAGLVIFITTHVNETSETERIERLPLEFQPVQSYVESCVSKLLVQGLKRLGETGGYIYPDTYGISSSQLDATNENAFRFNPYDPNTIVAYWWHFKSYNKCAENCYCGSEKPTIEQIEEQLSQYILNQFPGCLNNFEAFRKQNIDITAVGDIKAEVIVAENDVSATIEYPLKLKKQESEIRAQKFYGKIPLNFKHMYEFAEQIANAEAQYPYLEKWTLEQINGFGLLLNENNLPPTSAADFDPTSGPVYWSEQRVKDAFRKMILVSYTPMLQVYGTLNYDERLGNYYEKTTLPIISPRGDTYYDLMVHFLYLDWWPIYFDISGRGAKGDLIGPETGSFSDFSWLGLKRYSFYYDVSYPVLVEIKDASEDIRPYFDRGYTFRFGIEANVRKNKPINCSGSGQTGIAEPSGTQICNAGCANVVIATNSAKDNIGIDAVSLEYGTTHESCSMGVSNLEPVTGVSELSVKLPQCVGTGCVLKASKFGYASALKPVSVRCDTDSYSICEKPEVLCDGETLTLSLEPKRTKTITVQKKRMTKGAAWIFNPEPVPLLKSEMAMITLQRIKESASEEDMSISTIYYGNQSSAELTSLVPGKYSVNINLYYELPDVFGRKEVVFKSQKICTPGFLGIGEECTTIGPHIINQTFPAGGSTYNFTLTKHDLDSYNRIIFYTISSPDASSFNNLDMNDMTKMVNVDELSLQYADQLYPDFEAR